ncbi:LmeA family phospholipid-binding protein [Streptomyces physcomitrii]|uniref:DUF2993 domain-containing protein n=1 Tax=Streptomyces physcomitrii TaxID=2724184 RepID=A0ABX1H679_9ACTN|nr:DUF2993 domain-containing protein [Streptomyces physcomitrii]NKI42749.1 DUF2993 domain-containing protein [Streptomyces physcomitrii]
MAAVLLLALGADAVTAYRVENSMAEDFKEAQSLPGEPSVTVHGRPVLTQLARGRLERVELTAHDVPAGEGGRRVPVSTLHVELADVERGGADKAHAGSAKAEAQVSWADLSQGLGIRVGPGQPGGNGRPRVTATTRLPLVGEVSVSAEVAASGPRSIAFRSPEVTSGSLPEAAEGLLSGALERGLTLDGIPEGLALDRVRTTDEGLTSELSGEDVTFRRSGRS